MKQGALFVMLFFSLLSLAAPKVVSVSGEYTYYAPNNISLEQAQNIAIERARLEAIAEAFGTEVSQTNMTTISNVGNKTENSFQSLGGTEVKGDWLHDTQEPQLSISYDGGMLVVTAVVHGKARERVKADYELQIRILRNGMESNRFDNGDKFSIEFKSPVNGYLSVYLMDDYNAMAYCLLPYETDGGKARKIKSNTLYTLLSTADPVYPYQEETILTTSKDMEQNRIVFIYSTNEFVMPLANSGEYVPELSITDFNKWLHKNRMKDVHLFSVERVVEIHKK